MAHLSVSRIKVIMKSSSDADCVSKESVSLLTKATELFIKHLAKEAYKRTGGGKKLEYKDLANVVHSQDKYHFLREIMPKKITVAEYKRLMAAKGLKSPQLITSTTTVNKSSESDDSDSEKNDQESCDDNDDEKEDTAKAKPKKENATKTKESEVLEISSSDSDK